MNPGFNPPTLDTIRAALTNGKFEFLRLEVDENSNLNLFKEFITKLGQEIENWKTMKGLD